MPDIEDDDDLELDEIDESAPDGPAKLRQAAKRGKKAAKERDTLKADNDRLGKELAVYKAGLAGLDDKKVKAILSAIDGEVTAEAVKKQAVDFGWAEPETNPDEELRDEIEAHGAVSAAAQGAGKTPATTVLKPEDVNGWPIDRQMRLMEQHPDVYERLLQGEEVSGFAFA